MGINHIRLSAELIASLYPESLVTKNGPDPDIKQIKTVLTQNKEESGYPFLGKNLHSICFLVGYPDDEFIPEDQLAFLQKILNACKLNMDDIALVNANLNSVDLQVLKNQFQPRIIFLWGAVPAITGLAQNFPDMAISTLENIRILPVLQADSMSSDNPKGLELKRKLWISLKKLFNLEVDFRK
ncbi:MAG TPA: hypothetical protein VGZ90_11010 [Puia sp.]|jgi:hypothetical protein|nr:hypothetical protein [Puia sp.]